MRDLRIIFMGTPEFAVASLSRLVESGNNVIGVVTAPDRPKGRGQKLALSPVKEFADSHDIKVFQPANLKAKDFHEQLKILKPNLFVVVAFRMLPEVVWSIPEFGTFNLHASLLPQYRGAAPINWAIINGESETGVTTFFIKHEIDTGNIIMQDAEPINEHDTAGSLYERLMHKGADLVLKTVRAIAKDDFTLTAQPQEIEIKHAPKIFKEDCKIDWTKNSKEIYNFIRGLSPYPSAWTTFNNKSYKLFEVEISEGSLAPGEPISDGKSNIKVGPADGVLSILTLQVEGKRKMSTIEFLKGNTI